MFVQERRRAGRLLLLAGLALPLLMFGPGLGLSPRPVRGEASPVVTQTVRLLQESAILYGGGSSASRILDIGVANALVIEVFQNGAGGSLFLTLTDSPNPTSGFSAILDPNGTWGGIAGNKKFAVYGTRRYVSCTALDASGNPATGIWTVVASPIFAPSWQWPFADALQAQRASSLGSGSIATIWTPTAGKRIRLLKMIISATVAGRYYLDDNSNARIWLPLQANVPFTLDLAPWGYTTAADNNPLGIENGSGSTATIDVWMWGHEE